MIIDSLDVLLSKFELIHFPMSGSNCCFLTYIQVLQEAGKVVWYSHLFKNFPQLVVIHIVKGFHAVNEAGFIFLGSKISADGDAAMKLKHACSLEEKLRPI